MVAKGGEGKQWDRQGVWGQLVQTIPFRWLSSEVLLYCTGNCVRSLGIRHYRDDMRKRRYMHGRLQKMARHCKSATRTLV